MSLRPLFDAPVGDGLDRPTAPALFGPASRMFGYPPHAYRAPDGTINQPYVAVKRFQAQHGLNQDGRIGGDTLRAINAQRALLGHPPVALNNLGENYPARAQSFLQMYQNGEVNIGNVTPPRGTPDAQLFNMADPRVQQLHAMLRASGKLPDGTPMHRAMTSLGFPSGTLSLFNQEANNQALMHWSQTAGANQLRDMAVTTARNAITAYTQRGDLTALSRFEAADAWVRNIPQPTFDPSVQGRMAEYMSGRIPGQHPAVIPGHAPAGYIPQQYTAGGYDTHQSYQPPVMPIHAGPLPPARDQTAGAPRPLFDAPISD